MRDAGRLADDTVVATVMSNLGFVRAMEAAGITVRQTAVGDRYVLEDMRAGGFNLGGEQSGHVIMRDHATTGDGLLTALHVLQQMVVTGRSLRDLASVVTRFPQVLVNVPGVDKDRCDDPELLAAVRAEEDALGDSGRVLLRPSGTEPLVRVMVEAADVRGRPGRRRPARRRRPLPPLPHLTADPSHMCDGSATDPSHMCDGSARLSEPVCSVLAARRHRGRARRRRDGRDRLGFRVVERCVELVRDV